MPARAAWKGYLKLSQLTVPVKAFTATRSDEEIPLNQLHGACGQKIRQIKLCPTHGEIGSDDIISGYKLDDHRYLPLDAAELDALRPEDDKSISVDAFVPGDAIDPVYHAGRTYYLVPDAPPGQRPFCVLRDGMRSAGRHAVARVVIGRKQLLVLLRPAGRLVAMTVLEFAQKVRSVSDYESEVAGLESSPAERKLIADLIDSLTQPNLDLAAYRDHYVDGLDALIARRMAEQSAEAAVSPAIDAEDSQLVAALRASLAAAGVDPAAPPPPSVFSAAHRAETEGDECQERKIG